MPKRTITLVSIGLASLCLACVALILVYQLPAVRERVDWRVDNWAAKIRRALNPPEEVVFIPGEAAQPGSGQTPEAVLVSPPPGITIIPGATATSQVENIPASPTPVPTSTPSPTPLPGKVSLTGIVHEYQQFNNCGPANLAMALSYWGWRGDQRDTRRFLRPNLAVDDKNVNPAEMVAFVEQSTELQAITRVGGDLDLLRSLLAAGFPVLIEAGHHPPDDWWMGHYLLVSGYDDEQHVLTVQDSLINPDLPMSYDELATGWWRDFNYVYVLIFPAERQAQVEQILGSRLDETFSYQLAAQKAVDETSALQGRDQFFAWFNLGASQVGLGEFTSAAQAYDRAFEIYQSLSEDMRPYRLMWYVDGAYAAYYHTGRYQDVVNLANTTFMWVGQPVLEESYYWRGLAYLALGNQNAALADLQKSAELNPNFSPPRAELLRLGVTLP